MSDVLTRPAGPLDVPPLPSGKHRKRANMRGADKELAGRLYGGQGQHGGAWMFDGEWWWSVADIRVKTCGVRAVAFPLPVLGMVVAEVKVPYSVPGWLDIGPLTALELAERLGWELEGKPATRKPAPSKPKASTADELERVAAETGGTVTGPREVTLPAGYGKPAGRTPPAPPPALPATYGRVLSMLGALCEGAGPLEVAAIMRAADLLEEAMSAHRDGL